MPKVKIPAFEAAFVTGKANEKDITKEECFALLANEMKYEFVEVEKDAYLNWLDTLIGESSYLAWDYRPFNHSAHKAFADLKKKILLEQWKKLIDIINESQLLTAEGTERCLKYLDMIIKQLTEISNYTWDGCLKYLDMIIKQQDNTLPLCEHLNRIERLSTQILETIQAEEKQYYQEMTRRRQQNYVLKTLGGDEVVNVAKEEETFAQNEAWAKDTNTSKMLKHIEVYFVIDLSKPLKGNDNEIIERLNDTITNLFAIPGKTTVSTTFFKTKVWSLYDRLLPFAGRDLYCPSHRDGTRLLDVAGDAMIKILERQEALPTTKRPEETLFIIITDGYANSSRRYLRAEIKEMITLLQAKRKWTFFYFSTNINTFDEAARLGINFDCVADFSKDHSNRLSEHMRKGRIIRKLRRPSRMKKLQGFLDNLLDE